LLKLDEISLEVGYALVPLVDQTQGGQLLQRIRALRRHLALQLGFLVPSVHITDNLKLKPREYMVLLRGVEVARWEMQQERLLAISSEPSATPIEGIATNGNKSTMQMSMTNATGSCTNNDFGMIKVAYISDIGKPRAYCPLVMGHAAMAGGGGMPSGGCKPTFHGAMTGNPMADSGDKLEMYLLTQMQTAQMRGRSFDQLTERGHVNWYYKPQADPLFEPPPDFTKAN